MTSTHGGSQGDFDDRLAKALNSALTAGEQVVAQEMGDQGQAIVLTDSRMLVLKAGLAATGEMNGHRISSFSLNDISAVNLRKGPLGAVIQIAAEAAPSADGGRPDNVVIFTGPGRVRKAEAFVAKVETTGKTVNRVEPQAKPDAAAEQTAESEPAAPAKPEVVEAVQEQAAPEPPKGGRVYRPLAEEIYGEVMQAGAAPAVQQSAEAPAVEVPPVEQPAPAEPEPTVDTDLGIEDQEDEAEEQVVSQSPYNPNPRLPRPVRHSHDGPNRMLVTLGVLASLVFVGMAVMAPLREGSTTSPAIVSNYGVADARKTQLQLSAVSNYRSDVARLLSKADAEAAAFRNAVHSGNKASMISCSRLSATDKAWEDLSNLSAPPGLAAAKQTLLDGLVSRRNAVSLAAASASAGASVDARGTISGMDTAEARIKSGLAAIDAAKAALERQMGGAAPVGKKRNIAK